MVYGLPETQKLKYLISTQKHGRQKLLFLSAQNCKFILVDIYVTYALSISHYGVISRKSSVLIIGGECDGLSSSLVAKYTIDQWQRIGNLQNLRRQHRAIANGDRIYVIGGQGTL